MYNKSIYLILNETSSVISTLMLLHGTIVQLPPGILQSKTSTLKLTYLSGTHSDPIIFLLIRRTNM